MLSNVARRIEQLRTHSPKELANKLLVRGFGETVYSAQSARIIRAHDARWSTVPINNDPDLVALHRDGFVKLGSLGVDVAPLAARAEEAFDTVPQDRPDLNHVILRDAFLLHPTALAVLASARVNTLVRAYLGEDATFDFADLFRSPACSEDARVSGLWHHDRAGHRLLLWVLLNDLDERGRATVYSPGSHHRTMQENSFASSRYDEAFVDRHYPARARMTGRRGDAILTDTHGIHRAVFERGAGRRDVLMIAFSSYAKSQALADSPLLLPFGPHWTRFPGSFDPTGTLVRRERLRRSGSLTEYVGNPGRDRPAEGSRHAIYVEGFHWSAG